MVAPIPATSLSARLLQQMLEALLAQDRTRARDRLAKLDTQLQTQMPTPEEILEVLSGFSLSHLMRDL
jgi:hypothetical protein